MAHDRKALQMVAKTAHNIMALLAVHSQTMAICFTLINAHATPVILMTAANPTQSLSPPQTSAPSSPFFCRSR